VEGWQDPLAPEAGDMPAIVLTADEVPVARVRVELLAKYGRRWGDHRLGTAALPPRVSGVRGRLHRGREFGGSSADPLLIVRSDADPTQRFVEEEAREGGDAGS
jgi:hypothetical protein